MPSNTPRPERTEPSDQERLDAIARPIVADAILECTKAGWLNLDESRTAVARHHDLHDSAATVLRRLGRAGLVVTPAEESDSLL